jgi:hypothetical protein
MEPQEIIIQRWSNGGPKVNLKKEASGKFEITVLGAKSPEEAVRLLREAETELAKPQ